LFCPLSTLKRMRMYVILGVLVIILLFLLILLGYTLRAVRGGRKRRAVYTRLAAVAVRAEEAAEQRKEAADKGAALTALLPAIKPAKEGPRRVA
jgi:hypothetical protein